MSLLASLTCMYIDVLTCMYIDVGCTARDLAMDYDFYECADLIDELEKLKIKHQEDILRAERIEGVVSMGDPGS